MARTWVWGRLRDALCKSRSRKGQTATHLVQYFDKARMEINNPGGNPADPYYVTNGLLVVEMISGKVQTGVNSFDIEQRKRPAHRGRRRIGLAPYTPLYRE